MTLLKVIVWKFIGWRVQHYKTTPLQRSANRRKELKVNVEMRLSNCELLQSSVCARNIKSHITESYQMFYIGFTLKRINILYMENYTTSVFTQWRGAGDFC